MTTPRTTETPETQGNQRRAASPHPHEHGWLVESAHRVSTGRLLYVRCAGCGVRRVDQQPRADAPPSALSRELRLPG